jgi:hypothetical protein
MRSGCVGIYRVAFLEDEHLLELYNTLRPFACPLQQKPNISLQKGY